MFGSRKDVYIPVGEGVRIEVGRLGEIATKMRELIGKKHYDHAVVLDKGVQGPLANNHVGLWVEAHNWNGNEITLAFSPNPPTPVRLRDLHDKKIV